MPATVSMAPPAARRTCLAALTTAVQISSASCSAPSGGSICVCTERVAVAARSPLSPTSATFSPLVPRSIDRMYTRGAYSPALSPRQGRCRREGKRLPGLMLVLGSGWETRLVGEDVLVCKGGIDQIHGPVSY